MSKRIGVDLDGVCYHWDRTARYLIRREMRRNGDQVPPALHTDSSSWWEIKEVVPKRYWRWLWEGGVEEGLFRYGHIVKGAIEGLQRLEELGNLIVVTHRPSQALDDTLDWISLYFDKVSLSGVRFLSNGEPKSSVVPKLDLLIDDAPHNMEDWRENTENRPFILFGQPWNASATVPPGSPFWRSEGWEDTADAAQTLLD